MSVVSASPTEHRCSCGRTFLNAISLERHLWVTKHTAAEVKPSRDSKATLDQALKVLREKQAVQLSFDVKRRQKRRLRREILKVEQHIQQVAQRACQGAKVLGQSTLAAVRLALMIFILSGLVVTGMKIGTLLSV